MSQPNHESEPNGDDATRLRDIVNPSTNLLTSYIDECLLLRNISIETGRTEKLKKYGEEYLEHLEMLLRDPNRSQDERAVISSEIQETQRQLQRIGWKRLPGEPRGTPTGEEYIQTDETFSNN